MHGDMHIVLTVVMGLVVGALACLVTPGKRSVALTILFSIAGAFVAGLLGHTVGWLCAAAGWYGTNESAAVFASIVGAIAGVQGYRRLM